MSRRNRICLILSIIGIAYIIFGSLTFQEDVRPQQPAGKADTDIVAADSSFSEDGEEVPPATDGQEENNSNGGQAPADSEAEPPAPAGGSFFQKLARQEDVKILVIGDSIGRGIGASDEMNRWDRLLQLYLERKYKSTVTVQNECFGGCTSYGIYVHVKELAEMARDYDLTIVCCGQNDPDVGFSEIYEALLRNVNLEFESSSVLCILESTQRSMTDKMMTVRSLAEHYNAGVVDTIAAFEKNYDSLTQDGFYPNDEGQEMYFRTIINVIDPLVDAGNGIKIGGADNASLPDPIEPGVVNYDVLRFYPAEVLEKTDTIRYSLTLPYTDAEGNVQEMMAGKLGIVMFSPSGEYPVTAAIDGAILGETIITNYTEVDETRYYNFGEFAAGQTIRIKFETEEAAERLTGIYVSSSQ